MGIGLDPIHDGQLCSHYCQNIEGSRYGRPRGLGDWAALERDRSASGAAYNSAGAYRIGGGQARLPSGLDATATGVDSCRPSPAGPATAGAPESYQHFALPLAPAAIRQTCLGAAPIWQSTPSRAAEPQHPAATPPARKSCAQRCGTAPSGACALSTLTGSCRAPGWESGSTRRPFQLRCPRCRCQPAAPRSRRQRMRSSSRQQAAEEMQAA